METGLELFELAESVKFKHPKLYKRLLIVYFVVFLEYSQKYSAKILATTPKTVGKWVKRYQKGGKNALLDKPRSGRPRLIDEKTRNLIVRIAKSEPAKITDHLTTWSLQSIQRYLHLIYDLEVSTSSIHRILQDHGIVFRKVEETIISPDPMYEIKKKRIEAARAEANSKAHVAFLSLDEKGPIHALFHRARGWMHNRIQIPKNHNKSNGKVVLNAAFEPQTNMFWWYFSERRTGEAFLMLLMKLTLDPVLQRMEKVYLLMDNLNSHFTKNIKELLSLHPQFEVIRTPTYSPELNPIERVFADLDRQAIQNHYYKDTNELEYRMDAWLTNRMKQPVKRLKPVSGKKTKKKRMKVVLKL